MRTLQQIKDGINNRIADCTTNSISLTEALEIIKTSVEDVILSSGDVGKRSLITSQQLINCNSSGYHEPTTHQVI